MTKIGREKYILIRMSIVIFVASMIKIKQHENVFSVQIFWPLIIVLVSPCALFVRRGL